MKDLFRLLGFTLVAVFCFGLIACSSDDNDDDGVDTTPITLYAGQEKVIQGADTITASNRFVAYGSKNTVYGWHIGETSLLVNGKKTIPITVLPERKLYDNPICEWGCSMDYVKTNQKQGSLSSKSTSEILGYEDAGGATLLAYQFENGKLKTVMAVVSTNHTTALGEYLRERYLMVSQYKGKDMYFAGIDGLDEVHAKTFVYLDMYNINYWAVLYGSVKDITTRSYSNDGKNELFEMLRPFLTE